MTFKENRFELVNRETGSSLTIADLGARIVHLTLGGRSVIKDVLQDQVVKRFSGVLLAPWPNRLRDGIWNYEGNIHRFPINERPGNALHGLVVDKKFMVEMISESEAHCSYVLDDSSYPFLLEIFIRYKLGSRGLDVEMGARNLSSKTAPFGMASHPYFLVTPNTKLQLSAKSAATVDEKQIPTGYESVEHMNLDSGRLVSELNFDTGFTDLEFQNDEAKTRLLESDGSYLEIWQQSPLLHVMIYTTSQHPFESGIGSAIAIEPQSCPADALNTGKDLTMIEPGETASYRWGVSWVNP